MYVVATAGHVDHGKSTLVRALTGMEPDRYAEERRRGLTIDLGFAWMQLPDGTAVAFVDVPGHERFVSTMLAGVGPVPAVVLVVAADGGWSAQTAEHVALLDALGVTAGLLVVTRTDLADPGPVIEQAGRQLAATSLADIPRVTCSSVTGVGMNDVRDALARVVGGLPAPDLEAAARLWIDRSFTIRGVGAVVTGTLAAGQIRIGEELIVARTGRAVVVRGLQSLNQPVATAAAVSRVAVNLRGISTKDLHRGDALLSPHAWAVTNCVDVLTTSATERLPGELTMHVGSAAIGARTRQLGERGLRLTLTDPTALTYGDRVLLREPGSRRVVGADVLDPLPVRLERRRGAAVRRGRELVEMSRHRDPDAEVRRRRIMSVAAFDTLGLGHPTIEPIDGWFFDPDAQEVMAQRLIQLATDHLKQDPLDAGLTVGAAARLLDLPDEALLPTLLRPPWRLDVGRLTSRDTSAVGILPAEIQMKIDEVSKRLRLNAFDAPTPSELATLGLTAGALSAAVRAGQLIAIGDGVYLTSEAPTIAVRRLSELPQPFTTSEARIALDTSRRVALPLLHWLDSSGATRRLPDDRRHVSAAAGQPPPSN